MLADAMILAACGGGDGGAGDLGEDVFGGIGEAAESGSDEGEGPYAGVDVGPLTQTADPGTGWVEVDGERYEFEAFGSTNYNCEVLADRITINFQRTTTDIDFLLQGGVRDGQWSTSLTFVPRDPDTRVSYGATPGQNTGMFGIGDQAISYEGTVRRVEDFDSQNAQTSQVEFPPSAGHGCYAAMVLVV